MVTYFTKQLIKSDIYIKPSDITRDLHQTIYDQLVQKIECKCNDIGYVLKDSLEIITKSYGIIVNINNVNSVSYKITYTCDIIHPSVGETILCCIDNITNAGIIAYVKFSDIIPDYTKQNDMEESPVICIIPLNRFENTSNLTKGQKISVKITAVRNKLNQSNIHIVGNPV